MPKLCLPAAVTAALLALCAASTLAAPVTVNLRVEGSTQTLYEGPITTDARTFTTTSGGTHACDGHNQGANPDVDAGGTPTTAAYDFAVSKGLAFDALWFGDPADLHNGDFFINQIGSDRMNDDFSGPSWNGWNNYQYLIVGGCQLLLHNGDDVLWDFAMYDQSALRLSGAPTRVATGEPFTVTVEQFDTSGNKTNSQGATVEGTPTDYGGHATISFSEAGNHTFKATKSGAIRSNAATVCVYVTGSGGCGTEKAPTNSGGQQEQQQTNDQQSTAQDQPFFQPAAKDTTPPVVDLTTIQNGKTYTTGPRVLSGDVDENGGIAQVFLRLRATDGGDLTSASKCRWFSGKRGVFTNRVVPCARARFFRIGTDAHFSYLLPARLRHGKYVVDVKVLDKAYNAGRKTVSFGVK
jgi:hypothetical protein